MADASDTPLTTAQCAALLGISEQWLEIARVRGDGPPFVKMGRIVRYRRPSVLRWLQENEFQSTAQYSVHRNNKAKQDPQER